MSVCRQSAERKKENRLCRRPHISMQRATRALNFTNSKGHTHIASTAPAMHPEVKETTGLELFCGMAAGYLPEYVQHAKTNKSCFGDRQLEQGEVVFAG